AGGVAASTLAIGKIVETFLQESSTRDALAVLSATRIGIHMPDINAVGSMYALLVVPALWLAFSYARWWRWFGVLLPVRRPLGHRLARRRRGGMRRCLAGGRARRPLPPPNAHPRRRTGRGDRRRVADPILRRVDVDRRRVSDSHADGEDRTGDRNEPSSLRRRPESVSCRIASTDHRRRAGAIPAGG